MEVNEILQCQVLVQAELQRRLQVASLDFYRPGKKQQKFHELGAKYWQRAFFANNRGGKTTAAAAESVYHMTGMYPDWWKGRVFDKPTRGSANGINTKQMRGSCQRIMMGNGAPWERNGGGLVPKELLLDVKTVHGVADAIDIIKVRHRSGGISTCYFRSAEQDWESQQGEEYDWCWIDEEQPPSVAKKYYDELVTRTWTTKGTVYWTVTPQRGQTEMVQLFWRGLSLEKDFMQFGEDGNRVLLRMEIDDAKHLLPEVREAIKNDVQNREPHLAEARLRGIPTIGTGLIYPIPNSEIAIERKDFDIDYSGWEFIAGMDLGFVTSFTAVVWFAYDRKMRRTVLFDAFKIRKETPDDIAPLILLRDRNVGMSIPVAWPKDANQKERSTGNVISELYRQRGVNMLPDPAAYGDERRDFVEPAIADLLMAMRTGQFKVLRCPETAEWFTQKESYARDEDGLVAKTATQQYDYMDATRYAWVMMDRYAQKRNWGSTTTRLQMGFSVMRGKR